MPNTPEAQALMQKLMEEGLSEEEAYREAERILSDRGRYPEAPPDLPEPYRTTIEGIRQKRRDRKKTFEASRSRNFRDRAFDYAPQWRQDEQE